MTKVSNIQHIDYKKTDLVKTMLSLFEVIAEILFETCWKLSKTQSYHALMKMRIVKKENFHVSQSQNQSWKVSDDKVEKSFC